jgi:hypothetical protein
MAKKKIRECKASVFVSRDDYELAKVRAKADGFRGVSGYMAACVEKFLVSGKSPKRARIVPAS